MKTNIDIFHFMPQTKWEKDKSLRFWNIPMIIALQTIATAQLCSLYEILLHFSYQQCYYTFYSKNLNLIIHLVIIDNGGRSEWIGDNFCDDINNNEFCLYDDGDCCGLSAQKNFCFKCTCIGKLEYKDSQVYIQSFI